jgi:flagellar protein FliL
MANSAAKETASIPAPVPAPAPAKGSMKTIIIIVVAALVLVAGGGGGAYYFLQKSQAAGKTTAEKGKRGATSNEDEEAATADGEAPVKKAKADALELPDDSLVKQVIELQPYIVNLADQGEARYLRLTVSLGIGGEEGAESEKPNPLFTTRVRNAMLAVLTTKSSAEVLTPEGKAKLRKDLLRAARAASEEPHVEAIYITEFIVQL